MTDNDRAAFEEFMLRNEWVPARSLLTGEIEQWWHPVVGAVTDTDALDHWRQTGSTPPPF